MTIMANPVVEEIHSPSRRTAAALEQLCGVILLAGGTGSRDLTAAARRSVLRLPIHAAQTLLDAWQAQVQALALAGGADHLPLRFVGSPDRISKAGVEFIDDPRELRGTGGVLKDVTSHYDPDAYVLIASAATLLLEPLDGLVAELAATRADASFFASSDADSGLVMLIRCRCLQSIPDVGFIDLKEQAMPRIASANSVTVIRRNLSVAASLRTPQKYIRALRELGLRQAQRSPTGDAAGLASNFAFAEQWKPSFGIIEDGCHVQPGVRAHDSVLLAGAKVGRNATIVRSMICPGASVAADAVVVDRIVTAERK